MRILIANRGEIAMRIIRTAKRLGIETVAVFAEPDRRAPHVAAATTATLLGPVDLSRSYLSIEALLAAAARTGADAVHPGYGFLAERADFATVVRDAGLVWIGPRPQAISTMGSKIEARRLAEASGVPLVPGFSGSQDDDELDAAASRIGFPVMIKASAGGGGKGIRIVTSAGDFRAALGEVRQEAQRSFGDATVMLERYVQRPRHVEVQVIGDQHGAVVTLGTRECSLQRRYQKILEEAPAPNLSPGTEAVLLKSAVALASAMQYDSVGTVEYLVDDDDGEPYFLEMNTRLQVEHPVTEEVTGLDLVELQIRVACGEKLSLPADGPNMAGHSFEARINAEDAYRGFTPRTGTVTSLVVPNDARWESGVEVGSEITPYYDPTIAKLIVHGPDRDTARLRLIAALDALLVGGIVTNTGLIRWVLTRPVAEEGRITTRYLDDLAPSLRSDSSHARLLASVVWLAAREDERGASDTWRRLGRFRVTPHGSPRTVVLQDVDGDVFEVPVEGERGRYVVDGRVLTHVAFDDNRLVWTDDDVQHAIPATVDRDQRLVTVAIEGASSTFAIRSRAQHWGERAAPESGSVGSLRSPFPAVVTEVRVTAGDKVGAGQVLVVIEAMKMLHSLTAEGAGTVAEVHAQVGQQIGSGDVIITFVEPGAEDG